MKAAFINNTDIDDSEQKKETNGFGGKGSGEREVMTVIILMLT